MGFKHTTISIFVLFVFASLSWGGDRPVEIVVSVPGPNNLTYLPVDLIGRIGADQAEGAVVKVRHFGGGGVALQELLSRNSDFAVAGMPAAMSVKLNRGNVATIAAVSDAPLFVLMVRSDLAGKVKKISDLRGRVIGVNTSSISSKTTSQQLVELVLKTNGVLPETARMVSAGQSWDSQAALLKSRSADAIMGDEPFASRLLAEGRVFFLLNLADPAAAEKIPGAGFLHAALHTRPEVIEREPGKAEKMVRIVRRTLQWMAQASPEQIVSKLGIVDPEEKRWLLSALKKYPKMYSADGKFSDSRMRETEIFFRETSGSQGRGFRLNDMIYDRWAGRRE